MGSSTATGNETVARVRAIEAIGRGTAAGIIQIA
jgi:hypothetical protein